jgi:hypothetical protein
MQSRIAATENFMADTWVWDLCRVSKRNEKKAETTLMLLLY